MLTYMDMLGYNMIKLIWIGIQQAIWRQRV